MQLATRFFYGFSVIPLVMFAGCGPGPTPPAVAPTPVAPVAAFTVGCDDPEFLRLLKSRSAGFAAGRSVAVTFAPVDQADLLVVPPERLGALASELSPVPASLRAPDHPLQRARIMEVYRDALSGWAGTAVALPVAGDGLVLVTRADILRRDDVRVKSQARRGRDPSPPTTYEEWAELAQLVQSATNQPAMPPLPADDRDLVHAFYRLVSCYDRAALLSQADRGDGASNLSLDYTFPGGQSRVTAPSFVKAAEYFALTQPLRQPGSHGAAEALKQGAVSAVVRLRDLSQLPRDGGAVSADYTVSALPGTRVTVDAAGREVPTAGRGNYVPYVGGDTLVACVRRSATHADAAWGFAAELAGTGSPATLADPAVGSGPFRREDLEANREGVFLTYRFDAPQTKRLAESLRDAVAVNTVNPATVSRLPDAADRTRALAAALREVAAGQKPAKVALAQVESAWAALDQELSPDAGQTAKRHAANVP